MKVEAYIIAWNEIETIQFTIQHYQKFCDRITIFDNYSTDGTPEKAIKMGCEVKSFGVRGVLDDTEYIKVKNNCWKGSDADWVVVCDADEILVHDNMCKFLSKAKASGATMINTLGFDVFSHDMPDRDFLEIQTGIYSKNYSKNIIFSPIIQEINYVYGCHECKPKGDIIYHSERLPLFHYRNIGGPERLIKRHESYRERLSERNKRFKMGIHYQYDNETRVKEWTERFEASRPFSEVNFGGLV